MSDQIYYAYRVTNLSTGRSYYVNADHLVDLTQVWRSQMDFFMPGTRVQIDGQFGESRIFINKDALDEMKEAKDGKAEKA